ncbi:AP2-like ethylene-responsive transcription factor BBM [Olea europaea subsp. europaea]|uniref:AP2-like ethylene-responsive transcription factor BBM n=1 Tax=Olea europaea subsp. europaea TaxID=158383 RepID=A0A8S0PIY7_OLEEU|nr:AP2-like ethylene-responsive transcription factor BBM [Olea europaea subsp. europaea]
MKDVRLNSFSCSSKKQENQGGPKLENCLGVSRHTFNDQEHNNTISTDAYIYQEATEATSQTSNNNNSIGLFMIKTRLRNNPAPPQAAENKGVDEAAMGPLSVQTLSLSMSAGTQSNSHLPVTVNGIDGPADTRHIYGTIVVEERDKPGKEDKDSAGTQEEAAEAYDIAAIKFRGLNVVTNFEISRYDVKSIMESSTLPTGGAAMRLKDAEMALDIQMSVDENPSLHLTDGLNGYSAHHGWPAISFQQAQPLHMRSPYPYSHQRRDPDVNQSFCDLQQLQLGNAQNFLQHSGLHNLMSLDSSSMEHSPGSNSIIYSNNGKGDGNGTEVSFSAPVGNVIAQDEVKPLASENMFGPGTWDPYLQERNFYYQLQAASSNGVVKTASVCDQASTCNNRIPTGVPTFAARPNNMPVCHGA